MSMRALLIWANTWGLPFQPLDWHLNKENMRKKELINELLKIKENQEYIHTQSHLTNFTSRELLLMYDFYQRAIRWFSEP